MIRATLKRLGSWAGVYLFATCLAFFAGTALNLNATSPTIGFPKALAKDTQAGIPAGWQSYLERPDILTLQAKAKAPDETWNKMKLAHFAFVAQILEMYPKNTHIYFLARDSEHLFDVARMVTAETSEASRIHLLNVSRANMRDPHIKEYLSENGISEETLRKGKKVLFVDTGFSGTIPEVIGQLFPDEVKNKLKTHLVVSSTKNHPSSRAFLVHLNPSVVGKAPGFMHGTIVSYEHMPRFTDRSSRFVKIDGRFHPISPMHESSDGSVSKKESLKYMMDLRAEWEKSSTQKWFMDQREILKSLKELLIDSSPNAKATIQNELGRLSNSQEGLLFEAYLRDALDMKTNAAITIQSTVEDFGLKADEQITGSSISSKKAELIEKFPDWKPILENPDAEIPKLFQKKNWQMIGNLIDESVDFEINRILLKSLFKSPATGTQKSLQILFIEKADQFNLQQLATEIFSQPYAVEMKDLIRLVIEKGELTTLIRLAEQSFSKPHAVELKDLIRLAIEKGGFQVTRWLSITTFSKPHATEMKDLIRLVIESGDQPSLKALANSTFSQPHAIEMKDLIRLVIEKGGPEVLGSLAMSTFSKPHAAEMKDLFRLLIEKADQEVLRSIASHAFAQPHAVEMKDLIRLVIQKADSTVLFWLVRRTFSEPHALQMKEIIRLVIEKADQRLLETFALYVFSEPHAVEMKDLIKLVIEKGEKETLLRLSKHAFSNNTSGDSEFEIFKTAVTREFASPSDRKKWMDQELSKIGSPLLAAAVVFKEISPDLKAGDQIEIKKRRLTVVKAADSGRRGVVFQVRAENGALYALKVAKDQSPETLASLAQESAKAKAWQELKIPHAKVLVQEKNFVLKPWINGMSGEEIVQKFASGDPAMKRAALEVIQLVSKIRNQGAYIGDFRPANLIWNGKAWVIIDSGSIQKGMTLEEAQAKWSAADERGPKFERRWQIKPPQLPRTCRDIFAAA